jgi:hypothetical protein
MLERETGAEAVRLHAQLARDAREIGRLRRALEVIAAYDPERDGVWGPREIAKRALLGRDDA